MEKFQKYCLSVFLVIVCSNVSTQIGNGTFKTEDCKKLYELYNKFLNTEHCNEQEAGINESLKHNLTINDKKNAFDLLGNVLCSKNQKNSYHDRIIAFSEKENSKVFINSQKQKRGCFLAKVLYFKSKVSKIRNKDYLEIVV